MYVPVEGALWREKMTEKEDLLSTFMNRAHGRSRKTKKKRIRVGRHKSKSKSKSKSKRSVRIH